MTSENQNPGIKQLLSIMARLRDPETGCPWDLKQTFETIVPYTLEEAYEVAEAIEAGDLDELRGELGDLLFQVVFYARMAEEQGAFDFGDVVEGIVDKMLRRHPHVFGEASADSPEAVKRNWEAIKAEERQAKQSTDEPASALDGIAATLPALTRAAKIQKRAANAGFDWPEIDGVVAKVEEEVEEVRAEIKAGDHHRLFDEVGDLLFVSVNLARYAKIDPEAALRHANRKFERRFRRMEELLRQAGKSLDQCGLGQMEARWQQAKREEKG